jgi:tetratricopeptide (TPR) repeat protein
MKVSFNRYLVFAVCVLALGVLASVAFFATHPTDPASREARFLKRGKALMDKKDYARARIEFHNAIQAMPKDAEPYYQLAVASLGQSTADLRGPVDLLRKAIELNPKYSAAQVKLATLMATSRDKRVLDNGEERVKEVLAKTPDNPSALNTLAALELRFGKIEDATAHLDKALENAPGNLHIAMNLAHVKFAQHDLPGAEEVLKKVVKSSPQSAPAVLALAHFYIDTGRKAEAGAWVQKARQLDAKNPDALILLGAMHVDAGHLDQAELTYRELSALPGKEFKPVHALFLFREGKRADASAELERLAKQSPDDRNLRGLLVSAYVAQGKIAEAEKVLAAALQKNAKDIDALLVRAELYARGGKYKEAEVDLDTVLHFNPESGAAHYSLGKVYGLSGKELEQRQQLGEAVRLAPGLFAARADLAKLLLRSNGAKEALDLLDKTPEPQKETIEYLIARNWVLLALENKPEARKGIDHALARGRPSESLYQDALLRIGEKDYSGGRHSLEEILKTSPDSTTALDLLASSYAAEKNLPKAVQALHDYAAARPHSAPIQTTAGIWLAKAGKRDDARAAFSSARSVDPNYTAAAVALAEMDFEDGNLERARRGFSQVIAGHPESVHARVVLALTEEKQGDRAAAVEQLKAVLQIDSKNFDALNDLAYFLSRDNPDEALQYAQAAVELSPDSPDAQDTLGWIYYRKGVYPTAVDYLKRAVAKSPTPINRYHLGLAYSKVGDQQLSRQNVEAALKQDPKLVITEPIDK